MTKYMGGKVDADWCPIDEYGTDVKQLIQVLENLMNTKDQITSEEFANLLFEGESNV